MKCPAQLARDLSAGGGRETGHSVLGRQNATILTGRLGAGGENLGSGFARDGEKHHVAAGGGRHGDF
jgi:hypothetical protein